MPAQAQSLARPPLQTASGVPVLTVTLNPAIDRTITVPGFAAGAVNRALASSDKAGGKGVNVAIALALAGTAVTAMGLLGNRNRTLFTETFERLSITDAFIALEGETRTGFKIVNPDNQQTTDINLPGLRPDAQALATVQERLLTTVAGYRTLPAATGASWVALCGSLPPGVDAALYATWITALKAGGAHVLLDTSGQALSSGIAAGPTVIKPNRDELEALLKRPLGDVTALARAAQALIRAHGIEMAAVSMGAEGACLVSCEAAVRVLPVALPVHSATGAGDAMVAGILHAQGATCNADTAALARLACHGTAFSLATLQQPSPDLPAVFRERIARWLPQIRVEALAL